MRRSLNKNVASQVDSYKHYLHGCKSGPNLPAGQSFLLRSHLCQAKAKLLETFKKATVGQGELKRTVQAMQIFLPQINA